MENNDKVSNQQLLAKRYLEENDWERILSEMLNSLVHVRAKQPLWYMIQYLAGLMSEEERKQYDLKIPPPFPKGKPITKFPYLSFDSLVKKHLTKELFASLRYSKTKQGGNLNQILKVSETWPKHQIGCQLTDSDSLVTYTELLSPIINEYHKIPSDFTYLKDKSNTVNLVNNSIFPFNSIVLPKIKSFIVSISRNIKDYPYLNICSNEKRSSIQSDIEKVISNWIKAKTIEIFKRITYSNETLNLWKSILDMINYDDEYATKAQLKLNWPNCRSIYYTDSMKLIILVNFNEHLQIFSLMDDSKDLLKAVNSALTLENMIGKNIWFDYNKNYGFLNSDISKLGTGMTVQSTIEVKNVNTDKDINNIINDLQFDSYSMDDSSRKDECFMLSTVASFKLCDGDNITFLEHYYNNIAGWINLNSSICNSINKKFSKITFEPTFIPLDANIKNAYESTYDLEKNKVTSSGWFMNSLLDYYITNPQSKYGWFLQDSASIKVFDNFILRYLALTQSYDPRAINTAITKAHSTKAIELDQSLTSSIEGINICLIRNLDSFPFTLSYWNANKSVEDKIIEALNTINLRSHIGNYYSLNVENQKEQACKIIQENKLLLFDDINNNTNKGVIQFDFPYIYAVVNDIDHLKFYVSADYPGGKFNEYLFNVLKVINEFGKQIKFWISKEFGIITSCPMFLGTGWIASLKIRWKLFKDKIEEAFDELNKNKMFRYEVVDDQVEGRVICISNVITIGKSENEIWEALIELISGLIKKDLSYSAMEG